MIYKVKLTIEGVLIFSSEVRPMVAGGTAMGSYITPLPYIHNYPLIYGILGKSAEAYFIFPSLHQADYLDRKGKLPLKYTSVSEVLEKAKQGKGFYIYPAFPTKIVTSSFLLSAESWSYGLLTRMPTKNVFPRITSYTAFMPESEFITYMVSEKGFEIPEWIRIGKKRWGIMKVKAEPVKVTGWEKKEECVTSIPVNVKDAQQFGYTVENFSKILETSSMEEGIIGWATLKECYNVKGKVAGETVNLELPIPNENFIE
ncbi:hypothetical protein SJAV_26300 [Sulfurisphaera javensis]|uniref:CRISPR-associated protein Csc1 n=1 Tax=Sulfurisphaera javensis TaxID=2049879 RepID=A0AAT9GVD8_9CREN